MVAVTERGGGRETRRKRGKTVGQTGARENDLKTVNGGREEGEMMREGRPKGAGGGPNEGERRK